MSSGCTGRILRVDLGARSLSVETPPEGFYREYLGGRAVAAYYLLKEQTARLDPLSPESMLIFSTSVITGAPVPAIPRYTVAGKSPMTGGFGESEAGGFWGPELKRAGFDAIIIKGRASTPVYLYVHDGQAEIRDAAYLWGRHVADAEAGIRNELGDQLVRVATIGIAGENVVRYACILSDVINANGRHGFGAVMGAKRLKAIAVRGHGQIELHEPETIREIARWTAANYRQFPNAMGLHDYGTVAAVAGNNAAGMLPTKNFTAGAFADFKLLEGEAFRSRHIGRRSCFACPIGCKKQARIEDERFTVDSVYGSPEYETVAAFGSNLGIKDINAVIKANELCNKYGLDTISTGVTISFATECYINGLLAKEDTQGLELGFGQTDAMLAMIEGIARREGIGNLLAEGSLRAAKRIGGGAERFCVHVKGLELAMHDPRAKYAVGVGYAVGVAGPDHMSVPHDVFYENMESIKARGLDILGFSKPVDLLARDRQKTKMVADGQVLWGIFNVLGACIFGYQPRGIIPLSDLARLTGAVTGFAIDLPELMEVSRRAINMIKVFDLREGLGRSDDTLPARAFEPLSEGRLAGTKIGRGELEASISAYYRAMGWDPETGVPLPKTLGTLGLSWLNH